jgi:uncharacterized protein (DUF2147 family)
VVAVVALVAALAGTAVAADPVANSSALNKKKVKKIADKRINKAAPNLSVAEAESAGTVDGADAANLVQGFATVNDGVNPTIRNFGGKRIDSVAVSHPANNTNYDWTFTGDFEGVTANQVGAITNTYDSDTFVWCAGNNDTPPPVVTDTTLTLRTFCTLNASNTIVSEPHTVELFIGTTP